jgi:AcrR family transcriptional regulator
LLRQLRGRSSRLRQAQRLEATRTAILDAASERFGVDGYAATTMDAIAAAAGVAKGAVYHHFATKERLFEAVLRDATAQLADDVASAAMTAADIWDGLSVATEAYFRACSAGPTAQIVLRDGPAVLGWERWREIDIEHFGRGMPAALEAAMAQGLIARQPIEPLARLLLGAATEAAAAVAVSADPVTTGRAHADAFRALLEGLRRRP